MITLTKVFFKHKSKMTGNCYVSKFLRRSVNGKHLICFQSEPWVSNFLGVLDCASDLSRYKKQKAQTRRWRGVVIRALDL